MSKRKKKKTALKKQRSFKGISQKDIGTYRRLADKSYQGNISPVSKV